MTGQLNRFVISAYKKTQDFVSSSNKLTQFHISLTNGNLCISLQHDAVKHFALYT